MGSHVSHLLIIMIYPLFVDRTWNVRDRIQRLCGIFLISLLKTGYVVYGWDAMRRSENKRSTTEWECWFIGKNQSSHRRQWCRTPFGLKKKSIVCSMKLFLLLVLMALIKNRSIIERRNLFLETITVFINYVNETMQRVTGLLSTQGLCK